MLPVLSLPKYQRSITMLSKLKHKLSSHLLNLPGWRTNRKIIVIESDDWGSIRMPSREVYDQFIKDGIPLNNCPYNRFDSLASEKDLQDLFNVLVKFKDHKGNHPIITANTVVANPDFEKIQNSDFQEYFYEPFIQTLEKYPAHAKAFDLWKDGMVAGLFHPQFHGREHVNINLWFTLLRKKHPIFLKAFENGFWGLGPSIVKLSDRINIQATFDATDFTEIEQHKKQLIEGLALFEEIFGFRSKSFIANNFIWHHELNKTLNENGVEVIQGMKYQLLPIFYASKRMKIRHFLGEINKLGQIYLTRNCEFEPSQQNNMDNVNNCLKQISIAFQWNKPAIISVHRLNFVGYLNQNNSSRNLRSFEELLKKIKDKWPSVEFLTSDQLSALIE